MAGEDRRQLVGVPQDDKVATVSRSLGNVAYQSRAPKGG
jgi:hypothetical protein